LGRLGGQVDNLVNSIARLGLTESLERGIQERQVEARRLEHERAEVDAQLNQQRIELGDDALEYIAVNLREELRGDSLEDVRRVLRQVLVRVELAENDSTGIHPSYLFGNYSSLFKLTCHAASPELSQAN
jgi:hypothetical protein